MDVVLTGKFHSLADDPSTIEMNNRLDLLFMAMESYKIFSVLLGDDDDAEEDDEFYNAMEGYSEYDIALEAIMAEEDMPERDRKIYRLAKTPINNVIVDELYKDNPKLKGSKLLKEVKYLLEHTADQNVKAAYNNALIKDSVVNYGIQCYNTKKEKGSVKTGKHTSGAVNTNGSRKDYENDDNKGSSNSTATKAKRTFGEIIKEFFKTIGEWFKKNFGNKDGDIVDGEVMILKGTDDPDKLHEQAIDIVRKIALCDDVNKIQEYLQDLQNLINDTEKRVNAEAAEAEKKDKYVGVRRIISPSVWFKKVNEVKRMKWKMADKYIESLNLYSKLCNIIAKGIIKNVGADEIHKSVAKFDKKLAKDIKETNSKYDKLQKEATKRTDKGKSEG